MRIKIVVSDAHGNEAGWTSLKDIESPTSKMIDKPSTVQTVLESIVCDALAAKAFVMIEPEIPAIRGLQPKR